MVRMEEAIEEEVPTGSSISFPLMHRTVCDTCGHLHRMILIRKCDCCGEDIEAWVEQKKADMVQNEEHGTPEPSDSGPV